MFGITRTLTTLVNLTLRAHVWRYSILKEIQLPSVKQEKDNESDCFNESWFVVHTSSVFWNTSASGCVWFSIIQYICDIWDFCILYKKIKGKNDSNDTMGIWFILFTRLMKYFSSCFKINCASKCLFSFTFKLTPHFPSAVACFSKLGDAFVDMPLAHLPRPNTTLPLCRLQI